MRLAVRVTGPAGHSRYLHGSMYSDPAIFESDDEKGALTFDDEVIAAEMAATWRASHENVACDVVDLDDPERGVIG